MPLDWARTQNNLGNALWTLGERESGTARLEEAVAAYRAALQERTRERVPLDWAATQSNLGNALSVLGERVHSEESLQEALICFLEARPVFRSAGMPQQAGTISQNINRLYRDLAPNSFGTKQSLKQSR